MMLEAGTGSIVNVASIAALAGIADRGAYSDRDVTERVPQARFATPRMSRPRSCSWPTPPRSGYVNGVALPVDGGWMADAGWNALRLHHR
jgi:NAD(P)-dependent dehydrogenase (short-subunit alcohol dehydrogenase family)